jgi:hypothetical protein
MPAPCSEAEKSQYDNGTAVALVNALITLSVMQVAHPQESVPATNGKATAHPGTLLLHTDPATWQSLATKRLV